MAKQANAESLCPVLLSWGANRLYQEGAVMVDKASSKLQVGDLLKDYFWYGATCGSFYEPSELGLEAYVLDIIETQSDPVMLIAFRSLEGSGEHAEEGEHALGGEPSQP